MQLRLVGSLAHQETSNLHFQSCPSALGQSVLPLTLAHVSFDPEHLTETASFEQDTAQGFHREPDPEHMEVLDDDLEPTFAGTRLIKYSIVFHIVNFLLRHTVLKDMSTLDMGVPSHLNALSRNEQEYITLLRAVKARGEAKVSTDVHFAVALIQ